jgi:hypothetical protein
MNEWGYGFVFQWEAEHIGLGVKGYIAAYTGECGI